MKGFLVALGLVAVAGVLSVVGFFVWSIGPIGWKPPEVAPLSTGAPFQAEDVLSRDDGYLVAGVVGTTDAREYEQCSGRFALVELDRDGIARRAVLASEPERDRFCASTVWTLLAEGSGRVLLSGSAERAAKPSRIYPTPGTDREWFTFRFTGAGTLDDDFADRGVLRDTLLAGRVGDVLVTRDLERVTDDGEVRSDLLVVPRAVIDSWDAVLVDEVAVAVDSGQPVTFQTFEVEGSGDETRLHALHPYTEYPDRTVDLGDGLFNERDVVFSGGKLVVTLEGRGARVVAVDPRRRRLVDSFGRGGSVPLGPSYVSTAAVAVDPRGHLVVALTTVDHLHGYRLHARRLSTTGSADSGYGGVVREYGTDTDDPWVAQVVVGRDGRAVVLDTRRSALLRLTSSGRLDTSFGDEGVAALGDLRVCELEPARRSEACRGG